MLTGRRLTPLYFGPLGRRLFGCYHPPAEAAGPPRDTGVVLCPALGHESIQFHRAFQKLAVQLSEQGFPVLRFDFSGCGDSEGDEALWSLENWRGDIAAAVDELLQQARTPRVALVGLRLGASLAVEVAASREEVEALVLWDPVIRGADFLGELRAQHARMLGYAHVIPASDSGVAEGDEELLGFVYPGTLAAELEALDMTAAPGAGGAPPAPRTLLVESNEAVDQRPLRDHLAALGGRVEQQPFSNPHLWAWVEDFGKVHVPRKLLDAITAWLAGAGA